MAATLARPLSSARMTPHASACLRNVPDDFLHNIQALWAKAGRSQRTAWPIGETLGARREIEREKVLSTYVHLQKSSCLFFKSNIMCYYLTDMLEDHKLLSNGFTSIKDYGKCGIRHSK